MTSPTPVAMSPCCALELPLPLTHPTGGTRRKPSLQVHKPTAEEKAKQHEISDFLDDLRELGIGEVKQSRKPTLVEARAEEHNGTDSVDLMPPGSTEDCNGVGPTGVELWDPPVQRGGPTRPSVIR